LLDRASALNGWFRGVSAFEGQTINTIGDGFITAFAGKVEREALAWRKLCA
jgi:class 3 adenylate cyclase